MLLLVVGVVCGRVVVGSGASRGGRSWTVLDGSGLFGASRGALLSTGCRFGGCSGLWVAVDVLCQAITNQALVVTNETLVVTRHVGYYGLMAEPTPQSGRRVSVSISLTVPEADALDRYASDKGWTRSEVVRRLLERASIITTT